MSIINRIRTNWYIAKYMRSAPCEPTRAAGDDFNKNGEKANEDIHNAATETSGEKNFAEEIVETLEKTADILEEVPEPKNEPATNETPKPEAESAPNKPAEEAQASGTAEPVAEAAMPGGGHIADQNPNVINLGPDVSIDLGKLRTPPLEQETFQNAMNSGIPGQNAYLDYLAQQQMAANAQQQMAMGQPQAQNPNQQPPVQQPQPGQGRSKVDNPAPAKPVVTKAQEDTVNVDLNKINVETNPPKPPRQWPEAVNSPMPEAGPVEAEPKVPVFDNRAVTSKKNCKYLGEIEKLALECGVQIQMIPRPGSNGKDSGLIACFVYTPEAPETPNLFKCFTIDTGYIIDRRAKIFPTVQEVGFEDFPAYPVLIPKGGEDKNGKSKNMLNAEMFKDIFIGGIQMLDGRKPLYTGDFMELNKNVALITMPTNNMNRDVRVMVRDRLMKAMKDGVFDEVHKVDPYARFRFKPDGFDKDTLGFVLSNAGIPYRFCGPCASTKNIEIVFNPAEEKPTINYLN